MEMVPTNSEKMTKYTGFAITLEIAAQSSSCSVVFFLTAQAWGCGDEIVINQELKRLLFAFPMMTFHFTSM